MPHTPVIERHEGARGERIYRIPLRVFTRLEANVYVILDGAYAALVDTGSGLPESDADLVAGFEALRSQWGEAVRLETLSRIVVTHAHLDHYGGLDFVRRFTDAPLAMHAYDRRVIEHHRERYLLVRRELARFFRMAGLDAERAERAMALYHGNRPAFVGTRVATVLEDGFRLDDRFDVFHTPGHCPGQVCLKLGDLLFSADHVLPATFPHLAPESIAPWTGLAHYLASLDRIEAVPDVRLTLPGHGEPIERLGVRIAQIRASNARKLERVLAACEVPRTLDEIARMVYPKAGPYDELLALEKIGAYVEHLDQRGELAIANLDEVEADERRAPRYQRADAIA